jgi:hypothetical protein
MDKILSNLSNIAWGEVIIFAACILMAIAGILARIAAGEE